MAQHRLYVFAVPAAICAVWTVFAGKDVNWDLLNYHYYGPFQLVANRLDQDFFAAAAQSYLNPVGYLPFYAMVSWGWHSVLVSVLLAAAHSVSIALLYLLAWRLFAYLPTRERIAFSFLATALGSATAVFWATVGTSFLDPLLVPLMLAGLLVLLGEKGTLLAGVLFGAAAALKYSNAIFALAAFPLALVLGLRAGVLYVAGGALAVAALAGPWLALMWREFGNPVFPLLNAWFQSPHAPAAHLVHLRFAPHDLAAAAAFPFRMALLQRSLYVEIFAPDIRFAALAAAAVALPVFRNAGERALRAADWRLFAFFATAAALWLATSANGRYGMLVLLLAGVCLTRLVERALPLSAARITLGVLLALQLAMTALVAPPRWFVIEPWTRRWLPYEAPDAALRGPALYLTVETLPMAVVAPFVHPQSAFVNVRGQQSLPSDSARLAQLIERHRGRVRALGRALLVDGTPSPGDVEAYDNALVRFGYRIDTRDCYTILWRGGEAAEADALSRLANAFSGAAPSTERLSVGSCALRPAAPDPARAERERRVSAVFDRVEKNCPKLFRGQTAPTEPFGASGWLRHYGALDARLEAIGESLVLNRYRAGELVALGRLEDWPGHQPSLPEACR